MAHFYSKIKGQKGEATRCGGKTSGMDASVNGWESGIRVRAGYDSLNDKDVFYIYATYGSHASGKEKLISIVENVNGTVLAKAVRS